MKLLDSRINRRTLGGIAVGAAATSSLAYLVSAQDATPDADAVMDDAAVGMMTLADLENVPQIDIIANNTSYGIYQSGANQPGWYVFNLENASENDAGFSLARLPEGVGIGDFTSFLFQLTSGTVAELPEWLMDVTFAGGTYAAVGESNSVLLRLDAGEWVVFSDMAASRQSATTIQVLSDDESTAMGMEVAATPEGGEVAPEGFGSTFTVSVGDGFISADSSPSVGYNILGVRNDAAMVANFVLLHSTEAVEEAAATDLATGWMAGEESGANLVGGMGMISSGDYGYIELDAMAGSYVGFSSAVNSTGGSQFEDGAVIVFNVS